MIVFDLTCTKAHVFEAWFGSTADFEAQKMRGLLTCPLCGDDDVIKAVMAPAVAPKANRSRPDATKADDPISRLLAVQRQLEGSAEYVGDRFASEARALHAAGEGRRVYGEATASEAAALLDDGIPVMPLPFRPRIRSDA